MTSRADLDATLDKFAEICKPIVQHIEAQLPSTKDHYGDYMSAITVLAQKTGKAPDRALHLAIGVALQRAGANKQGVMSALRVMGVLAP